MRSQVKKENKKIGSMRARAAGTGKSAGLRSRLLAALLSLALVCTMGFGAGSEVNAETAASSAAIGIALTNAATGLRDNIKSYWMMSGQKMFNIRKKAKIKENTFDILQGSCTDGKKYAYFVFCRKRDDKVRIVKMRMIKDPGNPAKIKYRFVKKSKVLKGIRHGNDMAYVSDPSGKRRDMIIINTSATDDKNPCYLGFIDPKTLTEVGGNVFKYWRGSKDCDTNAYAPDSTVPEQERLTLEQMLTDHHGYSNIAYCAEKDLLVAEVKTDRDLIIMKPTWNLDGTLGKVTLLKYIRQNKINATSQGIDCDKKYIYTVWSPMAGVLDRNIIQVYDWEGNHIGDREVSQAYEMENLFHTGTGRKAVFRAGFNDIHYAGYTVKKKVRVRWKKVRRKVDGEWKKVWKYRTKTKKITKYKLVRDSYGLYLGRLRK